MVADILLLGHSSQSMKDLRYIDWQPLSPHINNTLTYFIFFRSTPIIILNRGRDRG